MSWASAKTETGSRLASLRQRFEQKPVVTATAGDKSKSPVKSGLLVRDNSIIPEGTDELLAKEERDAQEAVIANEASPHPPMSPSVGAASMTDPTDTLQNPFALPSGETAFPEEKEAPSEDAEFQSFAEGTPSSPSASGDKTIKTTSQRFSAISLGTSKDAEVASATPKADSIEDQLSDAAAERIAAGASSRESKRWSAAVANAAGRVGRRSAIYGDDAANKRVSIDGMGKLRENFERMQQKEKRKSQGRDSLGDMSNVPEAAEESTDSIQPPDPVPEDDIDWEFWGRVMGDYHGVARESGQELSAAIQRGIPPSLRGMMWQLMSGSKDEEMELIYAYYLKQTSPHEKAIRRDLARTFPEQDYFAEHAGAGQENLFNVVKAYSLYDEECGYCQGMQFIVGPLLLNMPDEEAFSTLVRLMKVYDLRGHFIPNMPSLQLRLYQFNRLVEDMLPLLHMHLTRIGIKGSMYASQWFMTCESSAVGKEVKVHNTDHAAISLIYSIVRNPASRTLSRASDLTTDSFFIPHSSYRFPLALVYRILDSVFAEGIESIFRFAITLLEKNEDALLKLNFEHALTFLKEKLFDLYQVRTETLP